MTISLSRVIYQLSEKALPIEVVYISTLSRCGCEITRLSARDYQEGDNRAE